MSRFDELIDATARNKIIAPLDSAWTLPPSAYTDASLFSEEIEQLFMKDWICVARTEQLPDRGSYLSVDLPSVPLVICRDMEGALHALSRICVHRAMPLVAGNGTATRFVCPYHNWTYELDGRLRSAPMMEGVKDFSPESCRLPELRLEVWNGFIFVNADPGALPLQPQLRGLQDHIANYDFEVLQIAETLHFPSPWNWKILIENFMEAYHHLGTHRDSLQPNYPARESNVPDNHSAPWAFLDMPGSAPGNPARTSFVELSESERQRIFAAVVSPAFLLAASNEMGIWYQIKPEAHDQMDLYIHILLNPELEAAMSSDEKAELRNQVIAIHEEDISANEGPWQGLNSRLSSQGRLSEFEKAIWQINKHWVRRMEEGQ